MIQPNCASTSELYSNALEKRVSSSQWLISFWSQTSRLLGTNNHPRRSVSTSGKSQTVSSEIQIPEVHKALQRYIGFLNYYRNYIPCLSEMLSFFFKLLKETSQFCIPNTALDNFKELNHQLEKSCSLALKQPIKNKQLILMTDASFTAAG